MNGLITLCYKDELRAFALSKDATSLGTSSNADLQITGAGIEPSHLTLVWEPRASTWLLSAGTSSAQRTLRLNGQSLSSAAPLEDGDLIEMPDVLIRFGLTPATPRLGDKEVAEIPLKGVANLVLGRASGGPDEGLKVELDAEDARVSRQHLELEQTVPGIVFATDRSATGTLLNGQRFDRRQLIVGDRLKLGSYSFEFTGISLRPVSAYGGAKVEARHLSFTLKNGRNILNDISVDIAPCSFVGILGGSGQGKSTLMNALCGVNPATTGEVYINGMRLGDTRQTAAAGIGYVPQDDIVHSELTVTEAITYSAQLKLPSETPRKAIRDLVEETIGRLGLAEHKEKRIAMLSGGQRKRVSIATELLAKPSVLFLDEPSSGLDPKTEFDLMSLLRRLAGTDCTVICTTHVLGRAYLFDQLCFVHGGHVIFHGTPDDAMSYFQIENGLEEIYLKVGANDAKTGEMWRNEFETSRPEAKPLAYLPPAEATVSSPGARAVRGPGWLPTLSIQLRRQWSILQADGLNLLFLLAQPIIIALLVGWVADDAVLRMFLCVVATLWFGCSNGAQQIVREISIFRRERVCGLGLNAYLQSKYGFLAVVTALQALLLLMVTLITAHVLNPPDFSTDDFYEKMEKRLISGATPAGVTAASSTGSAELDEFDIVTEDSKAEPAPPEPETSPVAPEVPKVTSSGFLMKMLLRVAVFLKRDKTLWIARILVKAALLDLKRKQRSSSLPCQ